MIIVTGLPRSGTSMMMHVLKESGINVLTDNKRKGDKNNPNYFEVENIGEKLKENPRYLKEFEKKNSNYAVKVLIPFVNLIKERHIVIFMMRDLNEIYDSIQKMIGEMLSDYQKEALKEGFIDSFNKLANKHTLIPVDYNTVLKTPEIGLQKVSKLVPNINNGKKIILTRNGGIE